MKIFKLVWKELLTQPVGQSWSDWEQSLLHQKVLEQAVLRQRPSKDIWDTRSQRQLQARHWSLSMRARPVMSYTTMPSLGTARDDLSEVWCCIVMTSKVASYRLNLVHEVVGKSTYGLESKNKRVHDHDILLNNVKTSNWKKTQKHSHIFT